MRLPKQWVSSCGCVHNTWAASGGVGGIDGPAQNRYVNFDKLFEILYNRNLITLA